MFKVDYSAGSESDKTAATLLAITRVAAAAGESL